jgi:hypothetical protein
MSQPQFAFLHVGVDATVPTILVRSIRAYNPEARIIQCSDPDSPKIAGVDRIFRSHQRDPQLLMTFRLQCFAQLDIAEPTLFLDTDMMCLGSLDPAGILRGNDVAVCEREFEITVPFNFQVSLGRAGQPIGSRVYFVDYAGKTIGEIYPYIACATITKSSNFWSNALEILLGMDPKFHAWYGDQEAIRDLVKGGKYRVTFLPESIYARLPDQPVRVGTKSKIYHFKGGPRTQVMIDLARKAGYL